MDSFINFKHAQHAHCESGVTTNLLRHEGIDISEPMAFGIGSGIFFMHAPFIKDNGIPATTYRTWPGFIFKRTMQRIGVSYDTFRFKSPQDAQKKLDDVLSKNQPVGMVTSVFYLDYLPEAFKFHFNAHNITVFGKKGDQYLVSDPVLDTTSEIIASSLERARFAKGLLAPNGKMYHISKVPDTIDFTIGIKKGIKQSVFFMNHSYTPWTGYRGIHTLGQKIKNYPNKLTERKAKLFLGHVIRMQEEIGTGGGGFRFLYAAFLRESGIYLSNDELSKLAEEYTLCGDMWRNFAYNAARLFKQRSENNNDYKLLSEFLTEISIKEKTLFEKLGKVKF